MKRISVDIGGTFTDCFFAWDEKYVEAKALTTHHNLALGFNEALDLACSRAGLDRDLVLSEVDSVRYATTLGTNALIERKGPKVAAIVTHGFEDTIPLSRGRGYGEGLDPSMQQNLPAAERPEPLVPRQLIRSVKERVNSAGKVVVPLQDKDVRKMVRELVDNGAEALVVSLTNATENPEMNCGSWKSSWRSTRPMSSARSPSCWDTRCPVARVSTCAPRPLSWTAFFTRSCSTH